jgi:hypothetical protein
MTVSNDKLTVRLSPDAVQLLSNILSGPTQVGVALADLPAVGTVVAEIRDALACASE